MVKCETCRKDIEEKEALVHKDQAGEKHIICRDCFKEATGVDYKTFAFRKENAKWTLLSVVFCLIFTIYAFIERGPMYGGLGLLLTVLVYLVSIKVR